MWASGEWAGTIMADPRKKKSKGPRSQQGRGDGSASQPGTGGGVPEKPLKPRARVAESETLDEDGGLPLFAAASAAASVDSDPVVQTEAFVEESAPVEIETEVEPAAVEPEPEVEVERMLEPEPEVAADLPELPEEPVAPAPKRELKREVDDETGAPVSREAKPKKEEPATAAVPGPVVKLGRPELISLAAFGLILLVGVVYFRKWIYGAAPESSRVVAVHTLSLPVKGKLVTIKTFSSGWREKKAGKAAGTVVPFATFTVDAGTVQDGFVRVQFMDSEGEIRGDVATIEFKGGHPKDSGRGEVVNGDEVTLLGTQGFESTARYLAYRTGTEGVWKIRLQEGADYSKGPWQNLGFVEIETRRQD